MMKNLFIAIRFKIFMLFLLGIFYPFLMTGLAQWVFPQQSNGNWIFVNGVRVGSSLIGQSFEKNEYFWSRPSAINFNPLPSGGSNLGQTTKDLKKLVEERKLKLKSLHPEQAEEPPQDLLFASGSGLDPHISVEAALYQLKRVAHARNLDLEKVKILIEQFTEGRQLGLFGDPKVNVLSLNIALDNLNGK
ncbi:MAG: potassium-transporting ATPase subunit KdpC [Bdellovibrionaceae bacterium]|nr:potassium-transporting ATPase subunit KdpC [Pseudobdellovibrionaceae bacterium]